MRTTNKSINIFYIGWILIVPLGVWFVYHYAPPENIEWGYLLIYFLFAGILSMFPIIINDTPIFIVQWIAIAVFLQYGLFVEVLLMQFSLFVLMAYLKIGKGDVYRYFLNSVMFFLMSVFSAIVYFFTGGTLKPTSVIPIIIPMLAYEIVNQLSNEVLFTLSMKIRKRKKKLFSKDMLMDMSLIFLVFPLGVGLYFLQDIVGYLAFVLIGIPYVGFIVILGLYNSSERINLYLQKAAEVGHQLTGKMEIVEVLDLFMEKISDMLSVDYAYILDVIDNQLVVLRSYENQKKIKSNIGPFKKYEGISGKVWATGKAALYTDKNDWKSDIGEVVFEGMESVLCVPIFRLNKVEGILFLASKRKKQYDKFHIPILDILCSYFIVALSNARHYEKTKTESEVCSLTGLYNYRYFENKLQSEYIKLQQGTRDNLSLIMIDIDNFKNINDTYGHTSGNDILIELAERLKKLVSNQGILARYGGEEFAVLLPGKAKFESMKIAEKIRRNISDGKFSIQNDLNGTHELISLHVTASIGVATAPEDAMEPMTLIRHADRALYTGAKRAGKNKVAGYMK